MVVGSSIPGSQILLQHPQDSIVSIQETRTPNSIKPEKNNLDAATNVSSVGGLFSESFVGLK